MGQPLSGKAGELLIGASNLLQLTQWQLDYGAAVQVYAARSGGGAEETVAGTEGGTGTFEVLLDADQPITGLIATGDLVSLACRHSATGPLQATGDARIGRFTFGANRDGTIQRVTVAFTCNGKWTFPT
jgi:hypothetical protein